MPSIRLPFDELTRQPLALRVQSEFGASARIVSASEVRVGGVGGFFARRYVDVVVDVPAPGTDPGPRATSVGLAALLEEAERLERAEQSGGARPGGAGLGGAAGATGGSVAPVIPVVSTQTDDFARLMSELRSYSEAPSAGLVMGAGAPALPDAPGSVVLFVGLGDDAMVVARSLARTVSLADVRIGGRILGDTLPRIEDRRQAAAFRARCIAGDAIGFLAWGLGRGAESARGSLPMLHAIDADQIWIVVDAARKPEDTAAWVSVVRGNLPAQAIAVLHGADTATPGTPTELGLPVGWSDAVG